MRTLLILLIPVVFFPHLAAQSHLEALKALERVHYSKKLGELVRHTPLGAALTPSIVEKGWGADPIFRFILYREIRHEESDLQSLRALLLEANVPKENLDYLLDLPDLQTLAQTLTQGTNARQRMPTSETLDWQPISLTATEFVDTYDSLSRFKGRQGCVITGICLKRDGVASLSWGCADGLLGVEFTTERKLSASFKFEEGPSLQWPIIGR